MVMDHAPTWSGRSLQQVELVVDEGLTVMDRLHVNVFLLHGVELQHRMAELIIQSPSIRLKQRI